MMYLQPVSFKQNDQTHFFKSQHIKKDPAYTNRSGGDGSLLWTLTWVSALILLSSWISSSLEIKGKSDAYSDAIVKRLKEENLVMKQAPTATSQKVDMQA
ncbi:MAG: hypothetical protein LW809_07960 [Vampirovibrionales bacterium]|jgi:hypothetical protein|nr:hypothetical protein [Vampirovibrionales bacterium]